jgi:hypothetical protein
MTVICAGRSGLSAGHAVKIGATAQIASGEMRTIHVHASACFRRAGSEIAKHLSRDPYTLGQGILSVMQTWAMIGTALAVSLMVCAVPAAAQSMPPGATPPAAASGATAEGLEADGRIAAVNSPARTIRLENGAEYVVPETLPVDWRAVREGSVVKLRYNIDQGRNLVTSLQVLFR